MTSPTDSTVAKRRGPKPNPEVRERLLRSGMDQFHRAGFHATGVSGIVTGAEVPKGSFYNHFPSKEQFGAEVVDAYFAVRLPAMRAILEDPALAPLERLKRYFSERTQQLEGRGFVSGCLLGNLSLEVADHSPEIRERLEAHFLEWSLLIEHNVEQAQSSGDVRSAIPARTLSQFVLNSWEGALLRARTAKSPEPLQEFLEVTFAAVLA